jgi:hypothetical protein
MAGIIPSEPMRLHQTKRHLPRAERKQEFGTLRIVQQPFGIIGSGSPIMPSILVPRTIRLPWRGIN